MARKKRKSKSNVGTYIGAGLIFTVCFAVLGGIGYFYYNASKQPQIDKETLCPTNGPVAVTAFLIDTTDPISETTLLDLRTNFQNASESIPVGSLLEIYGLTERPGDLVKMFGRCNPGDASSVSEWTNNPRLRQRKWQELFKDILDKVSNDLPNGQAGDQSPIMAGIQKIKLSVFDPLGGSDIPKTLIVASDMIEHTGLYSQYKSGIDFETYKKSAAHAEYATSLKGVDVGIWYIDRKAKKFGGIVHNEFWGRWVFENKGNFLPSLRLEGMN